MTNKQKRAYRKLFSHTPYAKHEMYMLSNESYRRNKYNFYFISSASLSLISATFFIGLLSVNTASINLVSYIEILISMLFFAISLSVNSFSLFQLFISASDEFDKTEILIIFQYRFFAIIKLISFLSPVFGMLFLISYFNEYISIISFIIFILLFHFNSKVAKRAKRKSNNILNK